MPDWQELVQQRLAGLELDPAEKEEVHAELAAHLEESYEAFLKEGLQEQAAVHGALSQVANWRGLQRHILIAKKGGHLMQKRVRQLWIPGFLTLILSTTLLMMLQKLGFRPRVIGDGPNTILLYLPWLGSLPFFGALGAYLSSRAGGSRGAAFFSSVFPVVALTAAFLLMFPIGAIIERLTGNHIDFSVVATALLSSGIGWLAVPGLALLLGGMFAQLIFSRRSSPQNPATG